MKTLRELGYTVRKAELDTYNTKNFEKLVDKELRERLDNTKTSLKEYIDGLNFETKTFLEPDHSQSIWLEYKTYDKYRKFLNDNNFSIEEVEVV